MKKLNGPLALLLAFVLCIGMLPVPALAAEQETDLTVPSDVSSENSEETENTLEEETQPLTVDTGTWAFQEWGGSENLEAQERWITPTEDGHGFVLNYGQIVEDRGENIVLYDTAAEQYADSVLELDLTVSDPVSGQDGYYSVAVLPRFESGADCEGLAIHDKGRLQRTSRTAGGESNDWVRDDQGDFVSGVTYHLKLVTQGDTMTAYAAEKGQELQELVSFTAKSGLGVSGYGFRIWRGAKTVKVENIVRTELQDTGSSLDVDEIRIPYEDWGVKTVSIPMTLAEGDSVAEVKRDDTVLGVGSEYQLMDNQIILEHKSFPVSGTFTLTVTFTNGGTDTVQIIREPDASAVSGWVVQKQNSSETTEVREGWITPTESGTGVVIDYGKIVSDTSSEGWVIFDASAPQYANSILEYDITFTDSTQGDWIAVAPVTRVTDGKIIRALLSQMVPAWSTRAGRTAARATAPSPTSWA